MPQAIVPVVAGVVGAVSSKNASDKANKAAKNAAAANAAAIQGTQTANNALYAPYEQRGNAAGDAINAFLGVGGGAAQAGAYDQYKQSTGYQSNMKAGSDAIASNRAAQGLLKSGATLKALTKFGQDTNANYTNSYLSALGNQQSAGLNAAQGNANSNSGLLNSSTNNNNALANAQGQAAYNNANTINDLLGNAVSAYGSSKGQSSYGTSQAAKTGMDNWYSGGMGF